MPINPWERRVSMPDDKEREKQIQKIMATGKSREEAVQELTRRIDEANAGLKQRKEAEQPRFGVTETPSRPSKPTRPERRPGLNA